MLLVIQKYPKTIKFEDALVHQNSKTLCQFFDFSGVIFLGHWFALEDVTMSLFDSNM